MFVHQLRMILTTAVYSANIYRKNTEQFTDIGKGCVRLSGGYMENQIYEHDSAPSEGHTLIIA